MAEVKKDISTILPKGNVWKTVVVGLIGGAIVVGLLFLAFITKLLYIAAIVVAIIVAVVVGVRVYKMLKDKNKKVPPVLS